jgi:hypothetical protein
MPSSIASHSKSRMAERITDFQHLTDELSQTDYWADPLAWDEVADRRCRALESLLDERPGTVAEFSDKFTALTPIIEEDSGAVVLNVLAEDMRTLARSGVMLNDVLAAVFAIVIAFDLMLVVLSIGGHY